MMPGDARERAGCGSLEGCERELEVVMALYPSGSRYWLAG